MDSAHPKLQLILEMKNQMSAGFKSAKQMVMKEVGEMKSSVKSLKQTTDDTMRGVGHKISQWMGGIRDKVRTEAASIKDIIGQTITNNVPGAGGLIDMIPGGKAALIAGGIGLITAAGIKATHMAAEWDKGMAKVNVTAQLQRKELRSLSDEMKVIAGRNAGVFEDVPVAFNKIISSGLDVNQSMKLLEPTLKAAKAGFTDVETVAGAAVSVMASSGLEDANRLYDILFATLNKGNAEFQDIATYLPKIIPMARQAGISLEETAGGMAYLTAQGFKAEAAATGLQNVFKSFSDGNFIKGFESIGIKLFDAEGKMRGLMPIVADLKKAMAGLTDQQRLMKFDKIGLDQEASGALASMIQDYEKLGSIINFVTNSQGEFNNAIKNGETAMDGWEVSTNRLKQSMTELGEVLLPLVDLFSRGVGGIMDFIQWGGGKTEDLFRFISGQESRYEEWMNERQNKKQTDYNASVGAKMNDERINRFVEKENVKFYAENPGMGMQGASDVALADVKLLEDQKKTFEAAIDSGNKKLKNLLSDNKIKGMDDFYRLMEEGSLSTVINKMQGLMPKAVATVPGDKTKNKITGSGVDSVVSGAKQQRTTIINIDTFMRGNLISQNKVIQNMSRDELLRFIQESFKRMMAGVETGNL